MDTKEFASKVLSTKWLALTLLGLIVFLIGAVGGFPVGDQWLQITGIGWRLALAAIGICLAGLGVFLSLRPEPQKVPPVALQDVAVSENPDVFLASPMAGFGDNKAYQKDREEMQKVIFALQSCCGAKEVYYAGAKIESTIVFQANDVAASLDLEMLRRSKLLIMIYPQKIVSSVLFEAGFAMSLGKPAIYFVKNLEDLPYLMQKASMLPHQKFPTVRIYTYKTTEDILKILHDNQEYVLDPLPKAA
jgi:nucleoside 2-deoxyribosyltransferase